LQSDIVGIRFEATEDKASRLSNLTLQERNRVKSDLIDLIVLNHDDSRSRYAFEKRNILENDRTQGESHVQVTPCAGLPASYQVNVDNGD
jgi:hypothetical protein